MIDFKRIVMRLVQRGSYSVQPGDLGHRVGHARAATRARQPSAHPRLQRLRRKDIQGGLSLAFDDVTDVVVDVPAATKRPSGRVTAT